MKVVNKTAQQIIEYLLLVAVVVVAILSFIGPFGPFRGAVMGSFKQSLNQINAETAKICTDENCFVTMTCPDPVYCMQVRLSFDVEGCVSCSACDPCCGNGTCDNRPDIPYVEDKTNCPTDCPPECGDPTFNCDLPANCAGCAACQPCCGDGSCSGGETHLSCPGDCGTPACGEPGFNCAGQCGICPACSPCCGDGTCNEDPLSCAADCPVVCGHPSFDCTAPGACLSCVACQPCCGDMVCTTSQESFCGGGGTVACPADCTAVCPNFVCDSCAGENSSNCSWDCGSLCGDGTCNYPATEDCDACYADCGWCTWDVGAC
ncbi:MAG TPA: hypothetical protein PLD92_05615, partial [Candidatus Omnitrophota bacterium]|nr:hypothetical protein [Candidatus Omnitrophota bacterium]